MKITDNKLSNHANDKIVNYFNIINEIKNEIPSNNNYICNIKFENDIKFIQPLFWIYFFNFYEELESNDLYKTRNIKLVLNITELNKDTQHIIITHLTQYIDYSIIILEDNDYNYTDNIIYGLKSQKNNISQMLLYISVKENSTTLLSKKNYSVLPITKITNINDNDFNNKEYWVTDNTKKEKLDNTNRKIFYNSLKLETIEKGVYRNKSEKVWNDIFNNYLNIPNDLNDTAKAFENILHEIVENIQKHTLYDSKWVYFILQK